MARCVLAVLVAAGLATGQEKKAEPKVPDAPEAKLAQKMYDAQMKRLELIDTRIAAGTFSGGSAYLQLADALQELTAAADELYPNPKDRLPAYELRAKRAKAVMEFILPRVEQGVEEPQVGPQAEGISFKADLALLKLRKQIRE